MLKEDRMQWKYTTRERNLMLEEKSAEFTFGHIELAWLRIRYLDLS